MSTPYYNSNNPFSCFGNLVADSSNNSGMGGSLLITNSSNGNTINTGASLAFIVAGIYDISGTTYSGGDGNTYGNSKSMDFINNGGFNSLGQDVADVRINAVIDTATGTTPVGTACVFKVSPDSTNPPNEAMRIASSGNGGIGTQNPTSTLDIVGNVNIYNPSGAGVIKLQGNTLNNIGIGNTTLTNITAGSSNTGFGLGTLASVTTGQSNTAVGHNALQYATLGGSNNTAVGFGALANNNANSNNTALGHNAFYTNPGNYTQSTAIGYNAQPSASNQIMLGTPTETVVTAGNVVVGGNLRVNQSQIHIGTGAGLTNQGLIAVAIGHNAGSTNQGQMAIAIGPNAGQFNESNTAIAIGTGAGTHQLPSGAVAVGSSAAVGTTNVAGCGEKSVCIGRGSKGAPGGNESVAIGNQANSGGFVQSVALGSHATCDANNQIRLGTASETVSILGNFDVSGSITTGTGSVLTSTGTTTLTGATTATGLITANGGLSLASNAKNQPTTAQSLTLLRNSSTGEIFTDNITTIILKGTTTANQSYYNSFVYLDATWNVSGTFTLPPPITANPFPCYIEIYNNAAVSHTIARQTSGSIFLGITAGTVTSFSLRPYSSVKLRLSGDNWWLFGSAGNQNELSATTLTTSGLITANGGLTTGAGLINANGGLTTGAGTVLTSTGTTTLTGATTATGLINANGGLTTGAGSVLTSTGTTTLTGATTARGGILLNSTTNIGTNGITFSNGTSSFSLQVDDTVSPNFLRFITGGTTTIVVSTAANVGIRTTTPAYPLDVVGYTRITGTLEVAGAISFSIAPMIARVFSATPQSIPNTTNTIVNYPDADARNGTGLGLGYSSGTFTNNNSYTLTLTVSANVTFAANATGTRVLFIQTSAQGRMGYIDIFTNTVASETTAISTSATFRLNANETFSIQVFQSSGSGLNVGNIGHLTSRVSVLVM